MPATALDFTITLDQLDRADLPLVGGKAANLGALIRGGLPVPPGFCVTAETYRLAVGALTPWIIAQLAGLDAEDHTALDRVAHEIRAAIERAPLDEAVAEAVRAAYAALSADLEDDNPPVAVRSSATAEDLPDSSFAGQQETLLNIRGDAALLDAVRRCWSSLWTPRAIAYRQRNGFAHDAVALAVVVQQMVDAEVAGVLFTADPVSGNRTRLIVNGAWGLGEAVVSGLVSPDGWTLDRDGAIVEQEIGPKERTIRYAPQGGTLEQATPPELRAQPCLTPDELRRLAALGRAAEQHFGAPQDIEWALRGGRLYLLQSRPITTLFPLPTPRPADDALRVYFSLNALQGVIEPLTPMGIDVFREVARTVQAGTGLPVFPAGDTPRLVTAASRLYADVTAALRHPLGRRIIQLPFRVVDPTTAVLFPQLLADERLTERPFPRRRLAWGLARFVWRARPLFRRVLRALVDPARVRREADLALPPRMRQLEQLLDRPQSLAERRMMVRALLIGAGPVIVTYCPPLVAPALLTLLVANRVARRWGLPVELVDALRQGLRGNPTSEMDLQLWQLSQAIKADPAAGSRFAAATNEELAAAFAAEQLPPVAQAGLRDFLARYGHRGVREIDVGMPRWSETPGYIINTIRNYLLLDDPALAADRRFAALERSAEQARAELIGLARQQRAGLLKALVLRFLTSRLRGLLGARELPKFWVVRTLALIRRLLQDAGAELVRRGLIDAADDVFFLELAELEQAASPNPPALRELVAERRASYQRELHRQRLPRILTTEGELMPPSRPAGDPDALAGIGVSPGVAQGPVRVIRDPHGAHLEPGEILVAPSTDPAWTPLFLTAGGLIMEAGGMLSHGSVVAREYGIPAVVGVEGATTRLATGALVQIDGSQGTIRRCE